MKWSFWHSISLFLLLGFVLLTDFMLPAHSRFMTWIVLNIVLIVSIMVIGHGITGLWRGALIDEENKMSLSRLQLLCWTVIVLSAFLSAAFINIDVGGCDPLDIAVPEQLWILLGISITSLVGSPLIKSTKKTKPFQEDKFLNSLTFKTLDKKGFGSDRVGNIGHIVFNRDPKYSGWADMFQGEEVANASQLDLSKIQMFYFTIIAIVAYVVALGAMFSAGTICVDKLPALSPSLLAVLAISHGGYLVGKAIPRPADSGDKIV